HLSAGGPYPPGHMGDDPFGWTGDPAIALHRPPQGGNDEESAPPSLVTTRRRHWVSAPTRRACVVGGEQDAGHGQVQKGEIWWDFQSEPPKLLGRTLSRTPHDQTGGGGRRPLILVNDVPLFLRDGSSGVPDHQLQGAHP